MYDTAAWIAPRSATAAPASGSGCGERVSSVSLRPLVNERDPPNAPAVIAPDRTASPAPSAISQNPPGTRNRPSVSSTPGIPRSTYDSSWSSRRGAPPITDSRSTQSSTASRAAPRDSRCADHAMSAASSLDTPDVVAR